VRSRACPSSSPAQSRLSTCCGCWRSPPSELVHVPGEPLCLGGCSRVGHRCPHGHPTRRTVLLTSSLASPENVRPVGCRSAIGRLATQMHWQSPYLNLPTCMTHRATRRPSSRGHGLRNDFNRCGPEHQGCGCGCASNSATSCGPAHAGPQDPAQDVQRTHACLTIGDIKTPPDKQY
jgi:hypothetical protein